MDALQKSTGARTKTEAIERAIREFLKQKAIEDLISLSGQIHIEPNWEEQEENDSR